MRLSQYLLICIKNKTAFDLNNVLVNVERLINVLEVFSLFMWTNVTLQN